ncbi:cell surface glycoprotein CD200 receptor 1-A-like isoform X1 [Harpia harpyja]|uniref:cell surface glycoprotein CD200 receptor 1-A-like isoform X1 n=1 Tax=Harpia harpyja TaxID=202280 RepID=UPI0022B21265|nr:cell surface glycoprotein CD200 receptor 1-A-like isoform X1 [Harpia harpyja]
MKAGADMKIAGKTVCVFVLLTITKVMRTVGNNRVSATVGNSCVLTCPPKSNITMVTWKISPKVGGPCTLGYRADQNKTDRTNCSDSINWKFRPDRDPALEIWQVGIDHEGNYTCEVVATEGNFHKMYDLTVLVPPRLTMYCDDHGNPVCKATAGKPAAQILWVLESNSTPKEEGHDNGTVTVLSTFTAHSTNVTNTTCIVSHPAGNQSMTIACHSSDNNGFILLVSITLCFLSIIIFMAVIYYFKLHSDRLCLNTKPPESAPTHSPQDDTMEVEPYTTYVQKENVIYNSVSDLTVGQNLPQGLSPAT